MSNQQRALPQNKEALLKSYNKRLKDDVKSILDNFMEIVRQSKVEDETQVSRTTQVSQEQFEVHVRSANIVRASESLTKLISDIKQYLILNDFPSLNESMAESSRQFRGTQAEIDKKLVDLKDDMAGDLYELEEEFYSSIYK